MTKPKIMRMFASLVKLKMCLMMKKNKNNRIIIIQGGLNIEYRARCPNKREN